MLQHNDALAAQTLYEKYLFQCKIPRPYWKHMVKDISFLDYQVVRPFVETVLDGSATPKKTKKSSVAAKVPGFRPLITALGTQQAANWTSLAEGVQVWDPKGPATPTPSNPKVSPEGHFSLYSCENLQHAQWAMYTMAHYMVSGIYKKSERPYRVLTVRNFELLDLVQLEDPQRAPNVIMLPTITAECNSYQAGVISELMSSSYRVFASTSLTPQAFFDRFGYLPYPTFYINEIKEVITVNQFLAAKEGVK